MKMKKTKLVSKWARREDLHPSKEESERRLARRTAALNRAHSGTSDELSTNTPTTSPPSQDKTLSAFLDWELMFATIGDRLDQMGVLHCLADLQNEGIDERREDIFLVLAERVSAIPGLSPQEPGGWRAVASHELAPALLGFFIESLARYRESFRSSNPKEKEKMHAQERRKKLEAAFLLKNRAGGKRLSQAEITTVISAFEAKVEALLPKHWNTFQSDVTDQSVIRASDAAFEAAYHAHYGRLPMIGDGDKDNVERIRKALGGRFPLLLGWDRPFQRPNSDRPIARSLMQPRPMTRYVYSPDDTD